MQDNGLARACRVLRPVMDAPKPGTEASALDDHDVDAHFRARGTEEEQVALSSLPPGVMKANFRRSPVLLKEGGIHGGKNAVANDPVEHRTGGGTAPVFGVEDTRGSFRQRTLAVPPDHRVLRIAIDLIVERVHHDLDLRSRGRSIIPQGRSLGRTRLDNFWPQTVDLTSRRRKWNGFIWTPNCGLGERC